MSIDHIARNFLKKCVPLLVIELKKLYFSVPEPEGIMRNILIMICFSL